MALVKTSKFTADRAKTPPPPGFSKTPPAPASKLGSDSQQKTILDRLAAATEELAGGLAEASAAAQQLRGSMEQIASGVLEDLGYRVLDAADGNTGLQILQSSQRVDFLITDIGLPGLNGRQLADGARVTRPNLKVLFMTGYAENAAGKSFLDTGMEIIIKPFTDDMLAAKIHEMIEGDVQR